MNRAEGNHRGERERERLSVPDKFMTFMLRLGPAAFHEGPFTYARTICSTLDSVINNIV